jgi:hypothetical protein
MRCYPLYPLSCDILYPSCFIFFLYSFHRPSLRSSSSLPLAMGRPILHVQELQRTSTQSGAKHCGAGGLGWGNPASFSTRSFTNAETLPSRAL